MVNDIFHSFFIRYSSFIPMRSLVWKLTAAFWLVSLIGIVFVAVLSGGIIRNRSAEFETIVTRQVVEEQLKDTYMREDRWPDRPARRNPGPNTPDWVVVDELGTVQFANRPNARPTKRELENATKLQIDNKVIGYLVYQQRGPVSQLNPDVSLARNEFVRGINSSLMYGGIGVTFLSLIIGLAMSRQLVKPLQELTAATRKVAQGNLGQQVSVRSADEIGELAIAFNQMGAELASAQDMRRQMTADIAHDLRTPLSIILGHAEGLIDGVLPPDQETFAIIHDESIRLNRLIDDLRTLSLAEAGELPLVKRKVAPQLMLERAAQAHTPQAQLRHVTVTVDAPATLPHVDVDPDRIAQVLDNLVSNALRYTPKHGAINLSATNRQGWLQIQVRDNGKGIPADLLPHIFERFYRADKSRRRDGSGSGLGLSISKSIIEQHGGQISAESTPQVGTTFTIQLPI
ncbi:MAG: sensor histidine kinase [Candidatus Promineifilaceae bacterium]